MVVEHLIVLDDTTTSVCHFNACRSSTKHSVSRQNRLATRTDEDTYVGGGGGGGGGEREREREREREKEDQSISRPHPVQYHAIIGEG